MTRSEPDPGYSDVGGEEAASEVKGCRLLELDLADTDSKNAGIRETHKTTPAFIERTNAHKLADMRRIRLSTVRYPLGL